MLLSLLSGRALFLLSPVPRGVAGRDPKGREGEVGPLCLAECLGWAGREWGAVPALGL